MSTIGGNGGRKGTGAAKSRPLSVTRKAAATRWAKYRAKKELQKNS